MHLPKQIPSAGPRVVVVGPDAAGKTTLVAALRERGYNAKACAQEHSYVPDMWQLLSRPDFLVFLDASWETIAHRREIEWGPSYLDVLQARLAHARAHCDLYISTDGVTPDEVTRRVCAALTSAGIQPQSAHS